MRAALDSIGNENKYYKLTAALPCGPSHMGNIDIPHVNSKLDELNLMSYDFGGPWSETTSINAPMVYQGETLSTPLVLWLPSVSHVYFLCVVGWGPADFSVGDCLRNWIDGEYET